MARVNHFNLSKLIFTQIKYPKNGTLNRFTYLFFIILGLFRLKNKSSEIQSLCIKC